MENRLLSPVNRLIRRVLDLTSIAPDELPDRDRTRKDLDRLLDEVELVQSSSEGPPRDHDWPEPPTVGYALACFVDELFVSYIPQWNWREHILERERYESRDRAWKFWQEAGRAMEQARAHDHPADRGVLEIYFLCVELGFIGNQGDPETRAEWIKKAMVALDSSTPAEQLEPRRRAAEPNPRFGWRWLSTSIVGGWIGVGVLVFLLLARLCGLWRA